MANKKEKDYVIVAGELNGILGLDPLIDLEWKEDVIIDKIKEAADLLEPEDELTELTKTFLADLLSKKTEDKDKSIPVVSPVSKKKMPVKKEVPVKKEGSASLEKTKKEAGKTTKFGSTIGSQAGRIDNVFLQNEGKKINIAVIIKDADVTKSRVKAHVNHLIGKKKIAITIYDEGKTKDITIYDEGKTKDINYIYNKS